MQNHQTHFKYILSSEVFLFNLQILFDQARSQFGGEKLILKYWHMIVYEWLMPLPGFFWSSSSGENQR